jgi:outer membrane protein assembly factor BamB
LARYGLPGRDAKARARFTAQSILLVAAAALLSLTLLACTRDIGGVSSGWNALVVGEGVVYVGTKDGSVQALTDRGDGDFPEKWRYPQSQDSDVSLKGVYSTPLLAAGLLYVAAEDGYIYALDRNGILRWKYDTGDAVVSAPVLVPRGLVVAPRNGRLLLLDVSSSGDRSAAQRLLSSQSLGDAQIKAPLVAVGESVYVGSDDGSVRRVEVKGGQVQMWCWHYENVQCN